LGFLPQQKASKNLYIEKREMKISNNFIRRILDSCDLIGILGRILAYLLGINKKLTTPPHLKISYIQGFEPFCYHKQGVNIELTYPLPKLGMGSIFVIPRHICFSKLGRGDFLARVYECFKKSVRAFVGINPHPSFRHLLPLHWAKENAKVGVECQ